MTGKIFGANPPPTISFFVISQGGNKKPLLIEEKRCGLYGQALFSSSPEHLLRAGFSTCHRRLRSDRLPWLHWASPSATRDESVHINGYG